MEDRKEESGEMTTGDPHLDQLLAELAELDDGHVGAQELAAPDAPPVWLPREVTPLRAEHPSAPPCLGDPIRLAARTDLEHRSCLSCAARPACVESAGEYLMKRRTVTCLGMQHFSGRRTECRSCALATACGDIVATKESLLSAAFAAAGNQRAAPQLSEAPASMEHSAAPRLQDEHAPSTESQATHCAAVANPEVGEERDPHREGPRAKLATPSESRADDKSHLIGKRTLPEASPLTAATSLAPPTTVFPAGTTPVAVTMLGAPAVAAPTSSVDDYRFPDGDEFDARIAHARSRSTEELLEGLWALTDFGASASRADVYATRRLDACAIGWVLNERCKEPPSLRQGFRPRPPVKGKVYAPEARTLANDLRVLDLHWLFATDRLRMRSLLDGAGHLHRARAAAWASTKKDGADRAAELRISESVARELAVCRSKAIADQQRRDREALKEALPKICSALARANSRRPDDPMTIFRVMKALLLTRDESDASAAALLPMLDGPNWNARKVRSCRDWLKKQGVLKL